MAISKQDKQTIVSELTDSLSEAKGTVFASYSGITVKEMQELRSTAKEAGVSVKVVKNRLVKVAIAKNNNLSDIDTSSMAGQLMYAMSDADEVAPAQVIHTFSKAHPNLELRGGFDATGMQFSEEEVKALALLPSKDQLRGQLVGTIAAPLSGFANVLVGNTRGLLNVLSARKEAIEA